MKLIGTGSFTKAYLNYNGDVLLKSEDPIKEAIANGAFPKHRMFPQLKLVKTTTTQKWYEMKHFTIADININEYINMRQCRFWKAVNIWDVKNGVNSIRKHFKALPEEFTNEREVLLKALQGLKGFGKDLCFETPTNNMAIKNGQLIFLDCFFVRSKLDEIRTRDC